MKRACGLSLVRSWSWWEAPLPGSPLISQQLPARAWRPLQITGSTSLPRRDQTLFCQPSTKPLRLRKGVKPFGLGCLSTALPQSLWEDCEASSSRKPFLTTLISESLKLLLPAMCPSSSSHAYMWVLTSPSRAGLSTVHSVVLWHSGQVGLDGWAGLNPGPTSLPSCVTIPSVPSS